MELSFVSSSGDFETDPDLQIDSESSNSQPTLMGPVEEGGEDWKVKTGNRFSHFRGLEEFVIHFTFPLSALYVFLRYSNHGLRNRDMLGLSAASVLQYVDFLLLFSFAAILASNLVPAASTMLLNELWL